MQVDRLCTCGSQVIDFNVCWIIGITKIVFSNISSTGRVKQNEKNLKTTENLLSL